MSRKAFPAFAILLATSCGGSEPAAPPPPPTISITAGDAQTGEVGLALPQPVAVKVSDSRGPVIGATVTFAIEAGTGIVTPATATTDATGSATATWILGGELGEQRLKAAIGSSSATARATANPGPPEVVGATAGNGQFVVVNRPLPVRPVVRVTDRFGNPIAGVPVTFSVTQGGGTLADSTGTSNAAGQVTLGSWTVGRVPGFNRVRVSAGAITGDLLAIGTAAAITVAGGNNQTANAGTRVAETPAVLATDGDGLPLPGVQVTFEVTSGGGSLTGGTQTTNAQGIARPTSWTLGLTAGANALLAKATNVPNVSFLATGEVAVPAAMVPRGPAAWPGTVGNFVSASPSIRVTDARGNPVAGVAVAWAASQGGTVAVRGGALTDFDGRADAAAWRLGPAQGSQTLTATVASLPAATFTATAGPVAAAAFTIEVRYVGDPPTEAQRAVFDRAATRWAELIRGDLPDVLLQFPPSSSGCYPALDETVDDLVIFAELVAIDGPGSILGSAGPCLIRTSGLLPVVGRMRFDTADLLTLESNGRLADVILHEMGHVLGIGTMWSGQGLLIGRGGSDPYFIGPTAQAAFMAATGPSGFLGNIVPVENTGGSGTRDGHWREVTAVTELMTGFLNSGVPNPLSAITVGSLRDQGYVVNDAAADGYTLPAALQALALPAVALLETPLPGLIEVIDSRGRIVRRMPRQ